MMDTPLLALTRSRADPPSGPSPDSAAAETMRQLIQLRWLAVGGQLLTILLVDRGLGVALPLGPLLAVVASLALANLVATLLLSRHRVRDVELLLALLFDMGSLTAQLYLTGGAANPFIALYLLQVVLGAIVLDVRAVWVLAATAVASYAGLSIGSVPLAFPPGLAREAGALHALGAWISFALTGLLLALFITRITRSLRARERYLADLRQHAAEEDGIVRMGLFASGAAHELGTPLASLSVILNDWRREPGIAGDADLAGELEVMQAEVQRCKAIVTDILHSAGEPRGETLESTGVRPFINAVVTAWQPTHPAVPLHRCDDGLEGAALVAEPALRQAVWNLLDNAAEASPAGVVLTATRDNDRLVLAVRDEGSGFAPEQLAQLGKPYQSSKGAGHGVGLFLAANVARRLGGRLEAENHADGGAEVRLVLPLAPPRNGGS